jgi:hypothetical protein
MSRIKPLHITDISYAELLYDWRFAASQFVLASSPLRLNDQTFFFQLNSCGNNPYVTSSLTRKWADI